MYTTHIYSSIKSIVFFEHKNETQNSVYSSWAEIRKATILMSKPDYSKKWDHGHGCWFPGYLRLQGISRYGIDCVR